MGTKPYTGGAPPMLWGSPPLLTMTKDMEKKETLQLKHLAPYLPFELTYLSPPSNLHPMFSEPKGETIETMGPIQMVSILQSEGRLKPLLRPMSQLTEEIDLIEDYEININDIDMDLGGGCMIYYRGGWTSLRYMPYEFNRILFSRHFDIYGLLDKGLALTKDNT